jgi:hypothetical protein
MKGYAHNLIYSTNVFHWLGYYSHNANTVLNLVHIRTIYIWYQILGSSVFVKILEKFYNDSLEFCLASDIKSC